MEILDSLIGFAFILAAVTGAILIIVGCAFVLLVLVGGLWSGLRALKNKGLDG